MEIDSGKIYHNTKGYPYIIIDAPMIKGRRYAIVKFLETGTIARFRMDITKKGVIKDRYAKDILGGFCVGNVKTVGNRQEYSVWKNMLSRCYIESDKSYVNYGAKGVYVYDRWHCFEYFLEDIIEIDGYNEEDFKNGLLELDKDAKQIGIKEKVYSKETCMFLSAKENHKHRNLKTIKAIGISPEGQVEYIDNVLRFAEKYGFHYIGIYRCISGKTEYYKGWRFKKWD